MLSFKITYNGRPYRDIAAALKDQIRDKITEDILRKIKSYENEITKAGGSVTIDHKEDYSFQLILHDCPEELSDKVRAALQ